MIQFDGHIVQMGWFNHQLEQFFWKVAHLSKIQQRKMLQLLSCFHF